MLREKTCRQNDWSRQRTPTLRAKDLKREMVSRHIAKSNNVGLFFIGTREGIAS